jgi:hypothetical protein
MLRCPGLARRVLLPGVTVDEMRSEARKTLRCAGMKGSHDFVIAVAARSTDAPNSFVAFKLLWWKLFIDCIFEAPAPTRLRATLRRSAAQGFAPFMLRRKRSGPEATGDWGDETPPAPTDYGCDGWNLNKEIDRANGLL